MTDTWLRYALGPLTNTSLSGNGGYFAERSSRPTPALKYLMAPTRWIGMVSRIGMPLSAEIRSSRLSLEGVTRTIGAVWLDLSFPAPKTSGLTNTRHAVTLTTTRRTLDC